MGTKKAGQGREVRSRREEVGLTAMANASAEELALRSQNGCQASFAELVRRYGGRLLVLMQQRTGNPHDAEDLVQDTFVKAYRNIHRYQSTFRFSTWLFTIATRLANSHYRSQRSMQIPLEAQAHDREPDAAAVEHESRQGLWSLARTLSDNQYQALWLKYVEDMSIKEIAKVMSRSQVSVKVLLYRARMNLAKQLNKEVTGQALLKASPSSFQVEGAKCSAGSSE